jgi:hypothetical protein
MKKRGFLVLALVMTTAGVASAFAPISQSQDSAAQPPARDLVMPVVARQPGAALPVAPAPEPVVKKASFEVRQAPVPLLMKPRPPIEQKTVDAPAAAPEVSPKTGDVAGESAVKAGESAAKAAIEADGYKGVKVLRQGANGLWYAKAMRGSTEVPLTVNAAGHVSLE